jgi:cellulose synthase/poly-beta-1,6-N-acetylglucosamine synthase-like glycosyltransferase
MQPFIYEVTPIELMSLVLLVAQGYLFTLVCYLLFLTGSAVWTAYRKTPADPEKFSPIRFLVLVPAHNEEALLPSLLSSLMKQDYPRHLFAVHVIADNCEDGTQAAAARFGVQVHPRTDPIHRGKGYALQWMLAQIWKEGIEHDAVVILDADSTVSENFLKVLAKKFAVGEQAVQSYYAVKDPEQSWHTGLRYAALAVLHYLRPLGRSVFRLSAGLKGNGMAFSAAVIKQQVWSAAVTEDIEFHMQLLLAGQKVAFAPEAIVWGEMPSSLKASRSQHTRWESGRLQMAHKYIPSLFARAVQSFRSGEVRSGFVLLDAIMEHLLPPFSIMAAATAAAGLFSAALAVYVHTSPTASSLAQEMAEANLALAFFLLAGQTIYLLWGLKLVQAPRKIYRSLIFAPVYLVWKLWHYATVMVNRETHEWVRTVRNEG